MNVSELLAAMKPDAEELKRTAHGLGMASWNMPSDLDEARAQLASTAEWRFGERALRRLVESALPPRTVGRLLRRGWTGNRGEYAIRPDRTPDTRDRKVRLLAAQLAAAWNKPEVIDERMKAGLARELFAPAGDLEEAAPVHSEEVERVIDAHAPEWWNDTYFRVANGTDLPSGLERMERALFQHQEQSVQRLTQWWHDPSRSAGVLCLPTGGGKTRTAVRFLLGEAIKSEKVIWLTHREELLNQAIGTILESSSDAARPFSMGRFAAGHLKVQAPVDVLVASIPTLAHKRNDRLHHLDRLLQQQGSFGLIVVDECHHSVARTWKRLIRELQERCPNVKLLGLSATPTRSAEKEQPAFWNLFDGIVHEVQLVDLIERKVLAKPKVETVQTGFEFSATLREKADFERFRELPQSLVRRICEDEGRNNRVVSTFVDRREEWGSTLIFAATVEQGQYMTRKLREQGVEADEVYGDTRGFKRREVVDKFRRRQLQAVVNCGLFTEGTDLPNVQTVFLARPTRSKILFRQMVGRGMRGPKIGGSEECTVVAFFDEVNGLVKESLASTFSDEREAVLALGIEEFVKTIPPADAEPEADDDVQADEEERDGDDISGLERELRRLVRAHAQGRGTSTECSLLGWWEATRGGRRAFIPVFDDVSESVHAFVHALPSDLEAAAAAEDLLIPETVLTRFLRIARRPGVEAHYVDLEEATPDELQAVLDEVSDITALESDPSELAWLDGAEDQESADTFSVLVDGNFEAVAAENFWRLRKEWEHYSIDFGINDRPELAPALAQLLEAKALKSGVDSADAAAILDAAADNQEFPSVHRSARRADLLSLLKALRQRERNEWNDVVDKALASGLAEKYESKSDLLVAALVRAGKAA